VRVHAEVNECTDEHIARDAAEEVEIESFHSQKSLATDETQIEHR
jgi:hypothetical protein